MRLLVSGTTLSLAREAKRYPRQLGHLLTPQAGNSLLAIAKTGLPWAIDNGAFRGFDPEPFIRLCVRASGQPNLLWVAVPDVVADARSTLFKFDEWEPILRLMGLPLAFVGQDGLGRAEFPVDRFDAFFIGGSTEWKLSAEAAWFAKESKSAGKLVHMGRVNSRRRMRHAHAIGCDSVDGSSASMFGDRYIRKYCQWLRQLDNQRCLFD